MQNNYFSLKEPKEDGIRFIQQYSRNDPKIEITMPADSTLDEVIEAFEAFLKAATYPMDNRRLEIVEDVPVVAVAEVEK